MLVAFKCIKCCGILTIILLRILEVSGSNFCPEVCYPIKLLSSFLPKKMRFTFYLKMPRSSTSFLSHYSTAIRPLRSYSAFTNKVESNCHFLVLGYNCMTPPSLQSFLNTSQKSLKKINIINLPVLTYLITAVPARAGK
jgi:hypothetical protein